LLRSAGASPAAYFAAGSAAAPDRTAKTEVLVEAERQGISVVRLPEDQLVMFVGEARQDFSESASAVEAHSESMAARSRR
jgi:hypothetical protein